MLAQVVFHHSASSDNFCLIVSQFLYSKTPIAINEAITPTTINTVGLNAVKALPKPPMAVLIVLTAVITELIPVANFPKITNAPPIAVTIPATAKIVFFVLSSRLLNHSHAPETASQTCKITGARVSSNVPPSCIPAFLTSFKAFCILYDVVSRVLKASSVAPLEFCISPSILLNSFPLSPNRIKPAFPASALPHKSVNASPLSFAFLSRTAKTSPNDIPLAIHSEKLIPVSDFRMSETVVPLFPSSFNILFMYVVLSAHATPFAVIIAYPEDNWSSATLFALAVGITLPIAVDNSPTVTLPLFCV